MDLEGGGDLKTFKSSFTLKFRLFNFHSEHLNCPNPEKIMFVYNFLRFIEHPFTVPLRARKDDVVRAGS